MLMYWFMQVELKIAWLPIGIQPVRVQVQLRRLWGSFFGSVRDRVYVSVFVLAD